MKWAGMDLMPPMKIAHVIDPEFAALDLMGPYEIISRWPTSTST